jgi:hypothetical protein
MRQVVVEVSGGVVSAVWSDCQECSVLVVDHDALAAGEQIEVGCTVLDESVDSDGCEAAVSEIAPFRVL